MKLFNLEGGLNSGRSNAITVDFSGKVWVSDGHDIYVQETGNGSFVRLDLTDSLAFTTHQNIRAIRCGTDGNIWADTESGFLLCINPDRFSFRAFKHKKPEIEGDYFYHNISFDANGDVWIKGRNLEITKFERKTQKFYTYRHHRSDDGDILTAKGQTWYGVFLFDDKKEEFNTTPEFGIKNRIHTMCADEKGDIWLGGQETGLYSFNPGSGTIFHYTYNERDNSSLRSNTINKLYCDSEENIWIATDYGVCFLPGYYQYIENYRGTQSWEFSKSKIQCAIERKNGEWWFGTEANGVLKYNPQTDQSDYLTYRLLTPSVSETNFKKEYEVLKRYVDLGLVQLRGTDSLTLETWRRGKFPENNEGNVSALFEDSNKNVWIGLYNHVGFNRYSDLEGIKRFGLFYQPDLFYSQPLWGANWYMDFAEDKKGNFWVATWEGFGLNLFNRKTEKFEGKHFMPIDKPYEAIILHHALINDSLELIGGFRYLGLFNFKRNTFQHLKTNAIQSNKHWKELLKYDPSSRITRCEVPPWKANIGGIQKVGQSAWFITDGGLGRLDCGNLTFETVDTGKKIIFSPEYAGCMALSEESVWFCNGLGLFCYNIRSKEIYNFTSSFRKSFPDFNFMNVNNLFLIAPGRILVGMSSGIFLFNTSTSDVREIGLNLSLKPNIVNIIKYQNEILVCSLDETYILKNDRLEKAVTHFDYLKKLEGKTIYRFAEGTGGEEWFGTNYGLYNFHSDKRSFSHFLPSGTQKIDDVFSLPGERMILSCNNGFCIVNSEQGNVESLVKHGPNRLGNRLLSQLFVDSNNNLWVGNTENGIDLIRMPNEEIRHFLYHNRLDGTKEKCRVNDFCETRNGHVWAASSQGLIHFDHYKISDTIRISGTTGNSEIFFVQPDMDDNLWLGTRSGLWVYSISEKLLFPVSQYYNLGISELGRGHARLSDGRLLFCGDRQVFVIDSRLLQSEIKPSVIVPEVIKINGSDQSIKLKSGQKVKLSYKQNSFSVHFSLINLHQIPNQLIAFRTNESHGWSYLAASERQIRFESLQAGNYNIHIQSVDKQLRPMGKESLLKLEIVPPFLKRFGVRISMTVILLAGIILLFWSRSYFAKLREKNMQRIIDVQISDLRSSEQSLRLLLKDREKFMSIMSHDLKNPVKGIERLSLNLNQTWQKLDDEGRTQLFDELYKASSGASRLLDHLLTWSVQKQGLIQPGWENCKLIDIVSEVLKEVEKSAEWKQVQIKVSINESLIITTDREMISFILRNLLMNAIKYSFQSGTIELETHEKKDCVSIVVADYGIGMKPQIINNLFHPGRTVKRPGTDNEKGTGLGLIIVKEFIDRLGYSIVVDSQEGKGTIFTIYIPHSYGK
ncbi:MAG: ATP-binding protein [Prolixibacteraceae bacterium]|nr:ATP-binding protein [Prolixibacteraceae bacterium]